MKKQKWLLIILISIILALSSSFSAVMGANTGEWTTFRNDQNRNGYTTGGDSTNAVEQLWNYSTNAAVWSSPAVANGLSCSRLQRLQHLLPQRLRRQTGLEISGGK